MALKRKNLARQAGFTLLELMVVIVILGVLASMVVPNLMGNKEKADAQKATSDIVALEGSLDMYKLDNHRYPTTEQRLAATLTSDPQVLFLPDGEISRFTLTLQSYDKEHHFRVVSQGAAPVSVENDG